MKYNKNYIIEELKKCENNYIANQTLNVLLNPNLKIIFDDKTHDYNLRNKRKENKEDVGILYNKNLILINTKDHKISNKLLLMTCVHEVNHIINCNIFRSSRKKTRYMKYEILAYVAEHMFKKNMTVITRQTLRKIKSIILRDYGDNNYFTNEISDKIGTYY